MKRLIQVCPSTLERRVFATYELEGDLVRVQVTPDLHPTFEAFEPGIIVAEGLLMPADGRAYYDALELAYGHCSFCYVDQVDEHEAPAWARRRSPGTHEMRHGTQLESGGLLGPAPKSRRHTHA